MDCTMYKRGKCLKQLVGAVTTGILVRHTATQFRECQFDPRVWIGSMAVSGRTEDAAKQQQNCSMYDGAIAKVG